MNNAEQTFRIACAHGRNMRAPQRVEKHGQDPQDDGRSRTHIEGLRKTQ
jgi:hypothetical protein